MIKELKFKEAPKKSEKSDLCKDTAELVNELLNAASSLHKLHLKVTGQGSFAAHKATNEAYDEFPDHADDLAEGFQGAHEELLDIPSTAPKILSTVDEAVKYLNELKDKTSTLQKTMPYSEIVNELDNVKSTINSAKYKLLFLK